MSRDTEWIVTRRDDSHPIIVTLGHPTSVSDLFRVVDVHRTGHEGVNSCFTDVRTAAGLGRLVEGGIASMADVEAAENALQALMWHDCISVIVPGFKYRHGQLVSYARAEEPRSELAFNLFRPCDPYDEIYATEEVVIEDGRIEASSYPQSTIVGLKLAEATRDYLSLTPMQAAAISSVPTKLGAPAYFSDPRVEHFSGKRGFFGEFYNAVRHDWDEATAAIPDIDFSVSLPPLVSVVLDRARDRDSIPQAIYEVRDELTPVRAEMLRFSETLRYGSHDQREVEGRCRELKESFRAVVRASRMPQRPLVLTLLQLYSAARNPLDLLLRHLNPEHRTEDPRVLAQRTVTGRMFSKLLATDSILSLLAHFFTPAEIRAIENSMRSERR